MRLSIGTKRNIIHESDDLIRRISSPHYTVKIEEKIPNIICDYSLCDVEIKKGDKYIIESSSSGHPRAWHLQCYDKFMLDIGKDIFNGTKIMKKYFLKNRKSMINIKQ